MTPANEGRFAMKVWKTDTPLKARGIEGRIIQASQMVGFARVAQAIEYSPAWVTSFFKQEATLTLEGVARLLHAVGLVVSDQSSDEQVLVDDLSASALRQVEQSINNRSPLGDTVVLTDEEFYQLKSLAQYGMRHLFSRTGLIEQPAPQDQEAA